MHCISTDGPPDVQIATDLSICQMLKKHLELNASIFKCFMFEKGNKSPELPLFNKLLTNKYFSDRAAMLAQMVAYLSLVQRVWGSIPGEVIYFRLKIFNCGARNGGDVHFLIARLYITSLD